MDMPDRLPAVAPGIDHQTVASILEPFRLGNLGGQANGTANGQFRAVGIRIHHAGDMLGRDDQNMDRRLGVEVSKCDGMVVSGHHGGRNLPGHDATEDAIRHS